MGRVWQELVSNPAGEGTALPGGGKLHGSFGKDTKELQHKDRERQGNKSLLRDRINLSGFS